MINHAGVDLRRFLLQPPAESRVSCEVRQGFSGLYLLKLWRTQSPTGKIVLVADCPHGKKAFPCIQSEWFFLQLIPVVFCPPPCST